MSISVELVFMSNFTLDYNPLTHKKTVFQNKDRGFTSLAKSNEEL